MLSGLLLERFSWASTFLINVPIALVALSPACGSCPTRPTPARPGWTRRARCSPIAGLATLLYGIIEGPAHGWTSPETSSPRRRRRAFLFAFVRWELRTDHPMLDVRLFKDRSFAIGSSTITLQYMAMFGLYFALAQYLQLAHGFSPLATAFIGLPIGIFAMIGAPLSARSVARFGPRRVVGTGLIVSAAGLFVLGFASPTMPIAMILLGFSLVGLGNGQTTAPSTTLIMWSVPRAKSGVGSAVNDLSREMGGALGIAVLGSVMASLYHGDIVHRLASLPPGTRDAAKSSIVATFQAAQRSDPSTAQFLVEQGKAAFSHTFGMAMLVGAAVILLNSLIVWTFQHRGRTADLPRPIGAARGDVTAAPGRPRRSRHAPGGSGVAPIGAVASLVGDGSMARGDGPPLATEP